MSINLKTLIGKLNDTSRTATTRAASICVSLGHYEVEIEHLFLALLEQPQSDLAIIAQRCDISGAALERDLRAEIARFRSGNARTPVFSRHLPALLQQAWLLASLALPQPDRIRSGHLLLALLTDPDLAPLAQRASPLFLQFPVDQLKHQMEKYCQGSLEEVAALADDVAVSGQLLASAGNTPALDQYTLNLTQLAQQGKLDPVIGREAEIRQAIDILLRRRQNNPLLTGEAGVGKTAVVEGLALRIAAGEVPPALRGAQIHSLDMGLLQAGASVKGEFESRLKNVVDEITHSPHVILLFIDEVHTIIGAGGQAGQNDAANLLKPALARGALRTIAATTWSEYKKYVEKDAALARRFQVVKVEEPNEDIASAMLRALVPLMEAHFKVHICDDAVTEAVRLSHRYMSGRQLPDKAISVLDTACARVALAQHTMPAAMQDAHCAAARIIAEMAALQREEHAGASHAQRLRSLAQRHADADAAQAQMDSRWQREQALGAQMAALRAQLLLPQRGEGGETDVSHADTRARLQALGTELAALQGDAPLVQVQVDGQVVAGIVAGWTGIPLGKMVSDDLRMLLRLEDALGARIVGQSHAISAVVQRVRTARAQLDDPNKPQGVFLFVGPSGVGKTETALALADLLYGGERKLITINMSEYQEAHSVSGLKGAPPGYVGYGEGGLLTEAVRRHPYSVVLLDEIEKAHSDVTELFFQVFDKGILEDAEGRQVDFRNTIIIATSNLASATLMQACPNRSGADLPTPEALEEKIRAQLMAHFKPAFLGRLKVVPFYPLPDEVLARVIALKLERIAARVRSNHQAEFSYDASLVNALLARCTEADAGARNVDHILNGTLLPEIATTVLARMADGQAIASIRVSATRQGQFKYSIK